jgi:hypothetical protein
MSTVINGTCTTVDCSNQIEKGVLVCVSCSEKIRVEKERLKQLHINEVNQSAKNVKELQDMYSLVELEKDELYIENEDLRIRNIQLEEKLNKLNLDYDQLKLDLEKAIIDTKRENLIDSDRSERSVPIQVMSIDDDVSKTDGERRGVEVNLNFPPSFKQSVVQSISNRDSIVKKKAFLARGEKK